jgi:hypothetical protein
MAFPGAIAAAADLAAGVRPVELELAEPGRRRRPTSGSARDKERSEPQRGVDLIELRLQVDAHRACFGQFCDPNIQ